jgi:5-methyltetrahydropteroyltriglutamate--homocysteine methyltransferase
MGRDDMPKILTTHAGSLPRPATLAHQFVEKESGRPVDEAALEADIDRAVAESVAQQAQCGLDIINDGEQGRAGFFSTVRWRMSGFGGQGQPRKFVDIFAHGDFLEILRRGSSSESVSLIAPPKAIGAVSYVDAGPVRRDAERLVKYLPTGRRGFLTAPSPGIVASALQNEFYPDLESYIAAVGEALAVEYRTIVDAGLDLQIDAPDLAMERAVLFHDKPIGDFLAFIRAVVAAINKAIAPLPQEKVRLHVCWGNYEGPHERDVDLADIWPEIAKAQVGAFLLSMANPRHAHDYHFFEHGVLPKSTKLIVGVIDTTTNYVEHPETVADRLMLAAKAVGDPTRIMAGTDCGFETSTGTGMVAPSLAWRKLSVLSEGAALATSRLFGG